MIIKIIIIIIFKDNGKVKNKKLKIFRLVNNLEILQKIKDI